MTKRCSTCVAFKENAQGARFGPGECRFNPPVIIALAGYVDSGGYWPRVEVSDWCQKYQERRWS